MTPQGVASRIDAVTVYRRGARITRVAEITADGGGFPRVVRLGGLPLGLEDASVRARVEPPEGGGAGADADAGLPAAVDLRVVLDVPDLDPSLRPADDAELEGARLEERKLQRDVAHIENQVAQLERLGLVARPRNKLGAPPPPSPTAARLALVRFKTERGRALAEELRAVRAQLERASLQRALLEDQALRASSARQVQEHEMRKAVLISLRGGRGQGEGGVPRLRLHVDYLVPGARWAPVYALRFDEGMTRAGLSLRAIVAQETGEDWHRVALSLSTAEAQTWTELPELASIRVGRRQPPPPRVGWRPPPTGVDDLYRNWDRGFGDRVPRPTPSLHPEGELAEEPTLVTSVGAIELDAGTTTGVVPSSLINAHLEELMIHGDDFEEETPVRGAPAAAAAPAPMTMMTTSSRPASRGRRRTAGRAAAAALPAARARSQAGRSADRRSATVSPPVQPAGGAMPGPAVPEPAPPPQAGLARQFELEASADLLRYGDLRMPPASSRQRGRLILASRVELYLALLIEQKVEVRFDVLAAVERARQHSLAVSLPPGCVLAWAEGYDYAYRAESRVDVPSDGDSHSLPLVDRPVVSEPLHVVVPRESTDVFRTARVANPLDSPLLPGPVDVYLAGNFLMTSRIELTPPRGTFAVSLGVEQGIKVARNIRYREESVGLMGGALLLHHQVQIEVLSHLGQPTPLEVRERIPVVREDEDDIQVSLQSVEPAWEDWEQEAARPSELRLRGGHRWRVNLAAGARQELTASYDIRIPAKQELMGGNRREES